MESDIGKKIGDENSDKFSENKTKIEEIHSSRYALKCKQYWHHPWLHTSESEKMEWKCILIKQKNILAYFFGLFSTELKENHGKEKSQHIHHNNSQASMMYRN